METRIVQVRGRGTVTLPARMRERYGIRDGDPLTIVDLDGVLVLAPKLGVVPRLTAEIELLREAAGVSVDELVDGVNDERQRVSAPRRGRR